jgi:hypothetical protein
MAIRVVGSSAQAVSNGLAERLREETFGSCVENSVEKGIFNLCINSSLPCLPVLFPCLPVLFPSCSYVVPIFARYTQSVTYTISSIQKELFTTDRKERHFMTENFMTEIRILPARTPTPGLYPPQETKGSKTNVVSYIRPWAIHRERSRMSRRRKEHLSYEQIVTCFVKACGLRKAELERLRVRHFYYGSHPFAHEELWIHVDAFEDIPAHEVPYADSDDRIIAELCKGKEADDLVFSELPDLDYEGLREEYADEMFEVYYDSFGMTGAPNCISELGQLLKQALGLRHYDEKRRRLMRWASRNHRRRSGWF